MAYSGRQLSPGRSRISNLGRSSDQTLSSADYHATRHNSYAPRSSTSGVIPISKETFINIPPPRESRPVERIDPYTGRPRRASLVDANRGIASTSNLLPVRSAAGRPTVVQAEPGRPVSPIKPREKDSYYVTPASSQDHYRGSQHKKIYNVGDGSATLVADVNIPSDRHHRRRDSSERRLFRAGSERDRGRRAYYPSNPTRSSREKSIDDEDAFSYTDAAGMYRDTEPRYRPRRGSLDRSGASRERPASMYDVDPRRSAKDNSGPPPSTRGWDKIPRSTRDGPQAPSPNRGRGYTEGAYGDARDPYYIPPRGTSTDRRAPTIHQDRYDPHEYDDRRDTRRHERRNSVTRMERPDRSVERRGFGIGIRSESRDSVNRNYRSSDESFDQTRYRDAGYAAPRRSDTAPMEHTHYEDQRRLDQERKDREYAERLPKEEAGRAADRDYRDRDYDRGYDRDYDIDRERERERARRMEPPTEPERDRQSRRQETRDQDYNRRDNSAGQGKEASSKPGLAQAATGGLAAAATTLGVGNLLNKSDKRDRDENADRNERRREDEHDSNKERRSDRHSSDEHLNRDAPDRDRYRDPDRGLGFAFEGAPEPSKNGPAPAPREFERGNDSRPVDMPKPAIDPDEEYRRRMEQVQRELGGMPDHSQSDSDPDRARRRRERERQRERELESRSTAPTDAGVNDMPPSQQLRGSFDDDGQSTMTGTTSSTRELRRQPSALDMPMSDSRAYIIDNSRSERREDRVRIVDPPSEEEEKKPKGILKRPTEKFPEHRDVVREGVAPLKDASKKGIPPGARWTKIDRRLVNPEALEAVGERYEERMEHVIVLRVLTKEDVQRLADRTKEIRDKRYDEDRKAAARRPRDRRDEYSEDDSADEFKKKAPKMLEAPSMGSTTTAAPSEASYADSDRRRDEGRY